MADRWPRIVVHADMDAFYAAVEQLDQPELRGKPILVGPRSRRGVVLTASYEARPFKVGSAMPMAQALVRCPHAIVVPPRFERYARASAIIMKTFDDFSPKVEALSLDEAFLEMTGSEHIFGQPEDMGEKIKAAVREATGGLEVSVGIAATKYVAKVASAVCKPKGLAVVPPDQTVAWLKPLPISRLWGAGPKTQARLAAHGFHTIGDIAAATAEDLEKSLGSAGLHFFELAQGRDPRPVSHGRRARSLGSERTLRVDVHKRADICRHLQRSADRVARRLRRKSLVAGGVRVRLKTTDFHLMSRQCTLTDPTDVADVLYRAAEGLLARFDHKGPFRLIGLTAHDIHELTPEQYLPTQQTLALDDEDAGARRRLETTLDDLATRFGDDVVRRASDVADRRNTLIEDSADLDDLTNFSGE